MDWATGVGTTRKSVDSATESVQTSALLGAALDRAVVPPDEEGLRRETGPAES